MQLDTEEGENFIPPAGIVASSTAEQPAAAGVSQVRTEPQARVDDDLEDES
jgi:hypothetical protein